MHYVDLLILGAGWTSDFIVPLLHDSDLTFAATTRDGRVRSGHETLKFVFDPDSDDPAPFQGLPDSQTVLITFPIYKSGGSERLTKAWRDTHPDTKAAFIQLGSTGIWNGDQTLDRPIWLDRHSKFDANNERARAETELLNLAPTIPSTVLDLSGLWGGQRHPRNWVNRVAPTKEALEKKENIHLIHGMDVARAIIAVHSNFPAASGQRWLLTDCRVYDWWDLASTWGGGSASTRPSLTETSATCGSITVTGPQPAWVRELMQENGVRALPRPPSAFSRVLDSRDFWEKFGLSPSKTLLTA